MKALISAVLTSFCFIHSISHAQVYSYDESLDIARPFNLGHSNEPNLFLSSNNPASGGNWSKGFTVPGIVGYIYATANDGTNIYIGGNFRIAGGIIANSIAKWDGKSWSSLGEGIENGVSGDVPSVEAITVLNGKVFVGGQFTSAGSEPVNGVACWDGQKWNKLGNDSLNGVRRLIYFENDTLVTNGFVFSLFAHKNKVYVGGHFDLAGTVRSCGVAAWDPETGSWTDMKGGLAGSHPEEGTYAYDFASRGTGIFVGGKFDHAGGVASKNIAVWDGTEWSALGDASGYVFDVEFDSSGALYATGYFAANDSNGSSGLGKWDGHTWHSVPGPPGFITNVRHIRMYKDGFFAGGYFESDTLRPAAVLAFCRDNQWEFISGLGQSGNEFLPGTVSGMELINDRLLVAGSFTRSGASFAVNVAWWDPGQSEWKLLDDGSENQGIHDGFVYAMEPNGDSVVAGGSFSVAGGVYAKNIAKWTGKGWKPLGRDYENGIKGSVYTILSDKNTIYAGGYFGSAGTNAAFHIARWDGQKWYPVGIGVGGVPGACVNALAKTGNYLYVGGYFTTVGDEENYDLPANSIARFDLTTNRWETLGRGIEYVYGIPGRVYALTADDNKLYVGGEFHSADDHNYDNFAVLTDNKWSGIDGYNDIGIEGRIGTIKVIGKEIYIGGSLKPENDGSSYGILKWEGKKWIPVSEPLIFTDEDEFVSDLEPYKDGFIAGGHFSHAGNIEVNNIAYYNGSWNDIGGGIFPGVSEMEVVNSKLFLAGPREFVAGGIPGVSMMVYDFDRPVEMEDHNDEYTTRPLWNEPNPFQMKTTVRYSISVPGRVRISLHDISGQEIGIILDEYRNAGHHEVEFDRGNLSSGMYICRMIRGSNITGSKMVILD
jgi:trimeric autotransporter adhesin